MEWNNFKSNDARGDEFLIGMAITSDIWKQARLAFMYFIQKEGFTAWHVHDGWVRHGYHSGDILHNKEIRLTWINSHAGYSHSLWCPEVGDKIIIVKNSPTGNEVKPFDLYIYEVVKAKPTRFIDQFPDLELSLLEVKKAVLKDGQYQFYAKKSLMQRIFKRDPKKTND